MSRVIPVANWTAVPNAWLRDKNLSAKALGILIRMNSLPPDWEFSIRGLATIMKEGVDSVRTALKELEGLGYLIRKGRERKEDGTFGGSIFVILEKPTQESPTLENPTLENPTQYNKEQYKKDIQKKEQSFTNVKGEIATKQTYGNQKINEQFDKFERLFGYPMKQTQANRRAAYNFLRSKDKGEEWLDKMMRLWRASREDRYSPRIEDFAELQGKLNKLMEWGQRQHITNGVTNLGEVK